ncbi:hypothetical protein [Cohnella sp. GbtcB17]|uniref:hypothetical protein n=1 Tax=Cohnella sp. GbtcB17 TaxID=2824762 RepID=UPI001C309B83|nr:hypothetical protein [Cohnella sp. GbtcB17]
MKKDSLPPWYEKLKVDASRTPGFTEVHMTAIKQAAVNGKIEHKRRRSDRNKRPLPVATMVGVAAVIVAGTLLLSYWGDFSFRKLNPTTFSSTLTATVSSVSDAAPRPIVIERLSGVLGKQLPFKPEDVVGITIEDNQHRLQPFEVPKDRLNVILSNLTALDMAAASITPGPEHAWVPTAYTMTFTTVGGSFAMSYDPSSNTYGTPDRRILANDQVWMLVQQYVNPTGVWAAIDRLHEQAKNETAAQAGQVTDRMYEQSRFDIGGQDYSGWEKKFLPLSSGIYFFDGSSGKQGLIQSLTQPAREYADPDVIKLSDAIIFTTYDLAYATTDGIQVGLTPAEVIAKLGLPNARTETAWSYRVGDALRFQLLFEDGKVRFISLTRPG